MIHTIETMFDRGDLLELIGQAHVMPERRMRMRVEAIHIDITSQGNPDIGYWCRAFMVSVYVGERVTEDVDVVRLGTATRAGWCLFAESELRKIEEVRTDER